MYSAKDRYTLIEQSSNSRITCMQYSQKNFIRVMIKRIMAKFSGDSGKNNRQNFEHNRYRLNIILIPNCQN